jgi:hypothetical protein
MQLNGMLVCEISKDFLPDPKINELNVQLDIRQSGL